MAAKTAWMGSNRKGAWGAIMIIEWLLMAVMHSGSSVGVPVQQTYATQQECEAARKIWDALTSEEQFIWVKSVCVKKVKT